MHPFSVESNGLYSLCGKLFSGNRYSSYLVQLLIVVLHQFSSEVSSFELVTVSVLPSPSVV